MSGKLESFSLYSLSSKTRQEKGQNRREKGQSRHLKGQNRHSKKRQVSKKGKTGTKQPHCPENLSRLFCLTFDLAQGRTNNLGAVSPHLPIGKKFLRFCLV